MKEILHLIQSWLMVACLLSLAAIGIICSFPRIKRSIKRIVCGKLAMSALLICGIIYGGSKKVSYPRTDPDVQYLVDNDSYVTNDFVHINFTRVIVPSSAQFYLDRRELASTNVDDWATFFTGAFSSFTLPIDVPCENATNFEWMAYTDWTPGPTVQTNGVWHANWGMSTNKCFVIPLGTVITINAEIIAPPNQKGNEE